MNTGDINHWKEEENTYQLEDDKLNLIQSCIHRKECITTFSNKNQMQ